MRIVILDREHDPGLGHPVYAENRPDLHDQHVWAVVQADSDGNEGWTMDYRAEGLTFAETGQY